MRSADCGSIRDNDDYYNNTFANGKVLEHTTYSMCESWGGNNASYTHTAFDHGDINKPVYHGILVVEICLWKWS